MKNRTIVALLIGLAMAGATQVGAAKTMSRGPFVFACVGEEAAQLSVIFLGARSDRARLTYKGETVVARHAISADGALYAAKDIEFWNKGDDGVLEWRGEKSKCALDD